MKIYNMNVYLFYIIFINSIIISSSKKQQQHLRANSDDIKHHQSKFEVLQKTCNKAISDYKNSFINFNEALMTRTSGR